MTQPKTFVDTRLALEQATEYLVRQRDCSPHEAQEWIRQEATAKRACLEEVARAIVVGETVSYHHSAPV